MSVVILSLLKRCVLVSDLLIASQVSIFGSKNSLW